MKNMKRMRIMLWSAAILFAVLVAWLEVRNLPKSLPDEQPLLNDQEMSVEETVEEQEPRLDMIAEPAEPSALLIPYFVADQLRSGEMVGTLIIPAIDFQMPVIADATAANLNRSPSLMKSAQMPGEYGNAVISGHRMYEFGSHFNRLDELKIGDPILLQSSGKEFVFEVQQITVVDPTEIWITLGDQREARLTLFACTPIRIATHRLVVFAVLKEEVSL